MIYRYIQCFLIIVFFTIPPLDAKQPWSAVEKRYRKELAQEEKKIISEFLVVAGRTNREWKRTKKIIKKAYFRYIEHERTKESQKLNGKEVTPPLENIIQNVLKQQGIDPAIAFIVSDNEYDSPMAVLGGAFANKVLIRVNEKLCNRLFNSLFELEAVILHEIQHIKNDDCFFNIFALKIIDDTYEEAIKEKLLQLKMQYSLFVERRADILAALVSIEHAKASVVVHNRLSIVDDWCRVNNIWVTNDSHPSTQKRVTYLTNLYHEMLEATQKNKNKRFFGLI